ncbi:hypothetical protein BJ912DRAFT_242709 [Pholiota molesta]|nr:hypothetical protein BJ912DRAFT_242709 [Pholiota molesta]
MELPATSSCCRRWWLASVSAFHVLDAMMDLKPSLNPARMRFGQANDGTVKSACRIPALRSGVTPLFQNLSASDLTHQLRSPSYISGLLKRGDVGRNGVYGLQAYRLPKIVGRRSVIGYKLDETAMYTPPMNAHMLR